MNISPPIPPFAATVPAEAANGLVSLCLQMLNGKNAGGGKSLSINELRETRNIICRNGLLPCCGFLLPALPYAASGSHA